MIYINDTDADIWLEALQFAVEAGSWGMAEEFHCRAMTIIEIIDSARRYRSTVYCDNCSHHKDDHYQVGEKDEDGEPIWACNNDEVHNGIWECDCDMLVLSELSPSS
jgi:hypothetical protein